VGAGSWGTVRVAEYDYYGTSDSNGNAGDLDAETTEQILDLLRRLNVELGMTLVMVTHDPKAASIASRQLRLEKGVLLEPTLLAERA